MPPTRARHRDRRRARRAEEWERVMSEPGVDHPEVDSEADITLTGRGISVSSRVEYATESVVMVRPSTGDYVESVVAKPGDAVEVFWATARKGARSPPRSPTSRRAASSAGA